MAIEMPTRECAFMLSEAPGTLSREEITVASGQDLATGTVLGKIAAGAATASAITGTGDATCSAVVVGAGVQPGVYSLTAKAATVLDLIDPAGNALGQVTAGAEADLGGLTFTITAGSTPMVAGDFFEITVAAGSGKFVAYDDTATDGSDVAAGVLLLAVDASTADAKGVAIVRNAEVKEGLLVGLDANGKADLAALSIFCRS